MHDRDIRDVRWILHVDASHDDVSEGAAEVFQRPLHPIDRSTHLLDDVVGDDVAVRSDPGGPRDAHHGSVTDRTGESELELSASLRRVHEALGIIPVGGRH